VDRPASASEVFQEITPIVVNGVMYMPSGNRVVALEPETGKEIWRYELPEGIASFRGVAYWPGDGVNPPRILFTSLKKLMALNAKTGKLDTSSATMVIRPGNCLCRSSRHFQETSF
jgi:quinoprotein glucose dehydrogenase